MFKWSTLALAGLATATLVGTGCGAYVHDSPRPVRRAALPVQPCPAPIVGHHVRAHLPAGIYRCNIIVRGSGIKLTGAGKRRTIIQGDIVIQGSDNVVRRMNVQGRRRVAGVNNYVNGKRYDRRVRRPPPRRHVYRR